MKESKQHSSGNNDSDKPLNEESERIIAKEYRLIPLEVDSGSDDWQIKDLIKQGWEYRKVGAFILGVVFLIGLIVALTKPEQYKASSVLLVESSGNQAGELLRNYGGLLGLSGNMFDQSSGIRPDLYPDVIRSLPFQLELIEQEIYFADYDTTVNIYTFFTQIYEPGFYHAFKRYTVGLNSLEREMGNKNAPALDIGWRGKDVLELSSSQRAVARGMTEVFEISVDGEKLTIEVWLPDPLGTTQLVSIIKRSLSEYVIGYQTEKAMQDLEFIERQYEAAKTRFINIQESLAEFRDENKYIATARAEAELQRIESEYNLAFDVYNNLAQQLEQARIKVQKDTPVFSTLEPAVVPGSPGSPNRVLIVIFSLFIGSFLAVLVTGGIVVTKNVVNNFNSL